MTRSLSTLKNMILIATFALLPLAAVNASAQNSAHVNVPFAFVANHNVVPAGYYQVISSETTLTLINANSGKALAMLLVRPENGDAIETQGRLSFQVSGSRHILTEAQFAGSSTHSKLLAQPKRERQVANNTNLSGATVEVAMK
jgi:hypothetical protein